MKNISDMQIKAHYLYIASADSGLRILDITDPANIMETGRCSITGQAVSIAVDSNLAYVAADSFGVRVIDVTNPANPLERGFFDKSPIWPLYDYESSAHGVAAANNVAYVSYQRYGIQAYQYYGPTGTETEPTEELFNSRVTTYPNPARGSITVSCQLTRRTEVTLQLYNILGQRVRSMGLGQQGPGGHHWTVDCVGLAPGVYFGRIEADNRELTFKFTIAK